MKLFYKLKSSQRYIDMPVYFRRKGQKFKQPFKHSVFRNGHNYFVYQYELEDTTYFALTVFPGEDAEGSHVLFLKAYPEDLRDPYMLEEILSDKLNPAEDPEGYTQHMNRRLAQQSRKLFHNESE